MSELMVYGQGQVSKHYGKPFITNKLPKIDPYLISMTVGKCKCCQETTYFIVDKANGAPWGMGGSKAEAISDAKRLYALLEARGDLEDQISKYNQEFAAASEAKLQINRISKPNLEPPVRIKKPLAKKMPKRALVFKKNDGKCFYCDDQLVIDGEWHVEHKHPKSKGGSNEIENLVPACPSCNLRKKDKTAKEFLEAST